MYAVGDKVVMKNYRVEGRMYSWEMISFLGTIMTIRYIARDGNNLLMAEDSERIIWGMNMIDHKKSKGLRNTKTKGV